MVEDDAEVRAILVAKLVGTLGPAYEVRAVGDGAEALRIIADEAPLLVVTDLGLPELGGLELCRRLRANPFTRATPIIAISGDHLDAEARAAGCDAFLTKPLRLAELATLVHRYLPPR